MTPADLSALESALALKPCPFCGGEAYPSTVTYCAKTVAENEWGQSVFHGVSCERCSASNLGLVGHRTPEKAAERWNTRAGDDLALRQENARLREREADYRLYLKSCVVFLAGGKMDRTPWYDGLKRMAVLDGQEGQDA